MPELQFALIRGFKKACRFRRISLGYACLAICISHLLALYKELANQLAGLDLASFRPPNRNPRQNKPTQADLRKAAYKGPWNQGQRVFQVAVLVAQSGELLKSTFASALRHALALLLVQVMGVVVLAFLGTGASKLGSHIALR